jgi:RNA polymerase sigma-70 factor (ECF subfamily)
VSLNVARGILRRHEDAQDAVQVAFMMAFRRLESFRGDASFKTWITRITVNCCLFQLREKRNRVTWVQLEGRNGEYCPDLLESGRPTPEKSAWHREIATAFAAAVARLPKNLRKPYTLFAICEFSLEDVASALGLSLAATKSRVYRARAEMRASLQRVWIGRHRV